MDLLIKVFDNPKEGVCSVSEHFKKEFKTGITQIDNIRVDYEISDLINDKIQILKGKDLIFELKGQDCLVLSKISVFLKEYLNIKIK